MASQSEQDPEMASSQPNRTRLLLTLGAIVLAVVLIAVYLAGWLPGSYDVLALAVAAAAVILVWVWPLFESRRQKRAART